MNILITGVSKGIGKALALSFSRHGNHKLFLVSRDKILLNDLKNQCIEINRDCFVFEYAFDLGNASGIEKLAEKIIRQAGKIDILVNNAGTLVNKRFSDVSDAEIASMFAVNFFAPASLIKNLVPALAKAGNANVINIGSMGGFQGSLKYPGLSYYSASKAALAVITECLAEEYKNSGISFYCLALGAVQTEMFSDAFPGVKAPVEPKEMAEFIVNFSLKSHPGLNGKIIPVSLEDSK
jgi:short-subunit dehydrogenase